jgi:hypothetical protein
MLREARRRARQYVPHVPEDDDALGWLALLRHHGAPTRLLDFTKSPYVAAYFALEDARTDAAVYALNTPALWSAAPSFDASLTRDGIDPREQGNYERYFLPNRWPIVWFGEPTYMDRRLIAQSGLFVMPGQLDAPLDQVLDGYRGNAPLLVKYVLPFAMRAQAMQSLYRMNVTDASLFPDLDGLARSTAYELEVVWERLLDDHHGGEASLPDGGGASTR